MTDTAKALAEARFADWFRKNYPGPDTIIHDPNWHAPRIFRAALAAYDAAPAPSDASRIEEAVLKEKMRMMEWCAKRQKITRLNWERAARKALAGDLSELRTRIDLIDAGPLDVVLSGEREQP